jgi:hypothetical protein
MAEAIALNKRHREDTVLLEECEEEAEEEEVQDGEEEDGEEQFPRRS